MSVGMPQTIQLNDFGYKVRAFFGDTAYHVGSSTNSKDWRDVDVRVLLDDDKYESLGLGDPTHMHLNPKWSSLCLAFSALGRDMTGLPIDFQIQQRTRANKKYKGLRRQPLGMDITAEEAS